MKFRKHLTVFILALILLIFNISFAATDADFTVVDGVIVGYSGTDTVLTIPSVINGQAVEKIGEFAFYENENLQEVIIPGTIKIIGEAAFITNPHLKKVKILNGTEVIASCAFGNGEALEYFEIPESINEIEDDIFDGSSKAFTVKGPKYVTNGNYALTTIASFVEEFNKIVGNSVTFISTNFAVKAPTAVTGGGVTIENKVSQNGEIVVLTVSPNTGYKLDSLTYTPTGGSPVSIPLDTTSFAMPSEDVTINAVFSKIEYDITFGTFTNGNVSVANPKATYKQEVTLTLTPNAGYRLKTLTYTPAGGTTTTVSGNTFTMPAKNVTVNATFEAIQYNVTVNNSVGGSIVTDKTKAILGDTITLTPTLNDGYELTSLTYTPEGESPITITTDKTFIMPAKNVTVTPTFTAIEYTITVNQSENGTLAADKTQATIGEPVTLTLTPSASYVLDTLKYNDGADHTITGTVFNMPAHDVTVTATFKKGTYTITSTAGIGGSISPLGSTLVSIGTDKTYTITSNVGYAIDSVLVNSVDVECEGTYIFSNISSNNTISVSFKQLQERTLTVKMSDVITISVNKLETSPVSIIASGTGFKGWFVSGIPSQNNRTISILMPNNNATITANIEEPTVATSEIDGIPVVSGGKTITTIAASDISTAVTANNGSVSINVPAVASEQTVEVVVPKSSVDELKNNSSLQTLEINTTVANLSVSKEALSAISAQASGSSVSVNVEKCGSGDLTTAQLAVVGTKPAYKFEILSNSTPISNFNGSIMITVPYVPTSGENTNNIQVYYIDKDGTAVAMNTIYSNNTVRFTTNHFSEYFIGEKAVVRRSNSGSKVIAEVLVEIPKEVEEVKINFEDVVENAWYYDAISYVVKNKIAVGMTESTFEPKGRTTRAQVLKMVCEAYGIFPVESGDNFTDAGNKWYTGYLAVAKQKGLVQGRGDNKFEPESYITRQELCVMLYSVLEKTNALKETEEKDMTEFTDLETISPWAEYAVKYFISQKVINGYECKVNPRGNTTRAEMAQIIYTLKK